MPHNPEAITERRQTHNRDAIFHALSEVQHALRRAKKSLLQAGQRSREDADLGRGDRAEIVEYGEMLKGMLTNLAEELDEMFPR